MLIALRVATSSRTRLRISAAAARCAAVLITWDQYGTKLRADHGGSSPSGVLPRASDAHSLSRSTAPASKPPNVSSMTGLTW